VVIIRSRGPNIEGTLHPLRWTAIAALALPIALTVVCLFLKSAGHSEASRSSLRILRYAGAAEILLLAVLAVIGVVYERLSAQRDIQLYHPPGKLVDIGGYRLHLNCMGSGGPTVVLEHGHQGSYFDWSLVQPEIARFTRVCYYDRAGYGWSDPSPRPRIPSVMSGELHSLLQATGEKPPYVLVSHSYGSVNAEMFAHKYPNEVAGLVLVEGVHTYSSPEFRLTDRLQLRAMQFLIPFGLPRWRKWCGGTGPQELRGERQAITCRVSLYEAFYRERAAFPESLAELRGITDLGSVPLMVIARDPKLAGEHSHDDHSHDDPGWEQIQQQKLELSKNSELIVATGSGHDVPQVRPDLIIAAAKKLLNQASGTGGHPGNSVK
jgi:pimeloyl-ACP methyl ester carboxylesterase